MQCLLKCLLDTYIVPVHDHTLHWCALWTQHALQLDCWLVSSVKWCLKQRQCQGIDHIERSPSCRDYSNTLFNQISHRCHRICVMMAELSECGFKSRLRPRWLCPWARHFVIIASLHPGLNGYLWGQSWLLCLISPICTRELTWFQEWFMRLMSRDNNVMCLEHQFGRYVYYISPYYLLLLLLGVWLYTEHIVKLFIVKIILYLCPLWDLSRNQKHTINAHSILKFNTYLDVTCSCT